MRVNAVSLTLAMLVQGCGAKQEKVETAPETEKTAPETAAADTDAEPELTRKEKHAAKAKTQVVDFLDAIRSEKDEQAYEESSYVLKKVYTLDEFLAMAEKLRVEEMPCITDDDVAAMEPTSGHVGIGPKDISVDGFLIRYTCSPGDKKSRVLFVLLDWGTPWSPPGGVASVWWREAPPE